MQSVPSARYPGPSHPKQAKHSVLEANAEPRTDASDFLKGERGIRTAIAGPQRVGHAQETRVGRDGEGLLT